MLALTLLDIKLKWTTIIWGNPAAWSKLLTTKAQLEECHYHLDKIHICLILHHQQHKKRNNNWDIHADNFVITNLVSNMNVKYATNLNPKIANNYLQRYFYLIILLSACSCWNNVIEVRIASKWLDYFE